MASLARPRAHSEMIPGSNGSNTATMANNISWLPEAFHRYTLPINLNQDSISPDGGWTHRIQSRFLGMSSLKVGSFCFPHTASFYEITESEISEIASSSSSKRSSPPHHESSDNNDPDCCVDALLSLSTAEIFLGRSSPMALPPKKRKRRRVIRCDVIFCLDMTTPSSSNTFSNHHPPLDREYFLFPRDAVVEAVNQASPFEVLVSYHLPKSSESSTLHSMCLCSCACNNYPSKLEEFAALCSSSGHFTSSSSASSSSSPSLPSSRCSTQRRLTDPGLLLWKPDCHVLNMQLYGVSRDLYIAMKQSVSGFETVCQRTMELMRLHTERLTCEKKEEPATTIPMALTKTEIQSEEEDLYDKRPLPWSSDDDYEDEDDDDDQETDFCMTSPHSKSSSSARGSPPAFASSLSSSTTITANTTTTTTTATMATAATTNNTNTTITTTTTPPTPVTTTTNSTKRNTNSNSSSSLKKCLYCGSKSTPMWRRGPQGAGTLCNACGVKWKHGKILCGNDTGPAPTSTTTSTTSTSRRRSSSNKSNSSNNERKRKTTTKKRSKAKERSKRPPPPTSQPQPPPISSLSEDDDLMTGVVHHNYTTVTPSTSSSSSIPRNISNSGGPFHHHNTSGTASSWETQHASSLSSYSHSLDDTTFSPLESFSSSPNSSTSMHDSMMLDKFSAGVDAVEAATVLTLLKRS
ncbi:hypothetical protein BDA99DRAFT_559311 [Phascolomyces articulosus]|uniref:GATA-type domain-containing protein n=1 Tax=Phascolomyces articulosus TaxID=60185 RepID=A0AAD5K271_9FUNG|nr:hypothetical protein BDA99DRAFT_559311 [Phascolomyces articulosus]